MKHIDITIPTDLEETPEAQSLIKVAKEFVKLWRKWDLDKQDYLSIDIISTEGRSASY